MKFNNITFLFLSLCIFAYAFSATASPNNQSSVTSTPGPNQVTVGPLVPPANGPVAPFSIDPRFPGADKYKLVFSPGIGNAPGISPRLLSITPFDANSRVVLTTFPFEKDHVNYLDCPAGLINMYCTSWLTPSESGTCPTRAGVIDPVTHLSACEQAGCDIGSAGNDTGYYTYAQCKPI